MAENPQQQPSTSQEPHQEPREAETRPVPSLVLSCAVCKSEACQEPKLFPCLHTACRSCILANSNVAGPGAHGGIQGLMFEHLTEYPVLYTVMWVGV
ncbi:Hypp1682 [Branchiostoma lanceolatum]|uniref:Hypp1682 protein n=1 Tax=Branchiostoma lanceolatum TaxID=7740 RepID=A0A8J9ZN70_BRALA|nr:Hypp1682 [Branchiostoma lanceolatum]